MKVIIYTNKEIIKNPKKEDKMINNRMTAEDLDSKIKSVTYTILPSGKTTVCELILSNGYVVTGVSSCLDIDNFDKELGEKYALKDAKKKAFEVVAYEFQTQITNQKKERAAKKINEEKLANQLMADYINNCIKKCSFGTDHVPEDVKLMIESSNKQMYKNICIVLTNMQKQGIKLDIDKFYSDSSYKTKILRGCNDELEALCDVDRLCRYFMCLKKEQKDDFNSLLNNIDYDTIIKLYKCM